LEERAEWMVTVATRIGANISGPTYNKAEERAMSG
jgi:hypothetical protein